MKQLLIVYHSLTGGTRQMAEAAAQAARRQPGVSVRLATATEVGADELLVAEATCSPAPRTWPPSPG